MTEARAADIWVQNYRNEKFFTEHQLNVATPLNTPRLMINVGAHKGGEAFEFARRGWDVHSFEANPQNYTNLLKECEAKKDSQKLPNFINEAVTWEDVSSITFYVSDKHPGIGSLQKFNDTHRPVTVPARTLKSYYAEHGITSIDFFLIDAERLDFQILRSHDWSIPISVIVCEFSEAYVRPLVNLVSGADPAYKHAIFMYKKLDGEFWEEGKSNRVVCIDRVTVQEYERRRAAGENDKFSTWGNIVFYK